MMHAYVRKNACDSMKNRSEHNVHMYWHKKCCEIDSCAGIGSKNKRIVETKMMKDHSQGYKACARNTIARS